MISFLAKVKIFRFWLKTMDYNKAFRSKSAKILHLQNLSKRIPYERASQKEQNGPSFSFIALSSEE